jgi:hypothetical protein
MRADLGARLVAAGLVTRDQLAEALTALPPNGGALAAELVRRGVEEDALAGFFVASGFGPVVDARELAPTELAKRLPGKMALDFFALPLRSSPAGLVVAMVDPSDEHALEELRHALGSAVVPIVARVSSLLEALSLAYPARAPAERQDDARPIELTRMRKGPDSVVPLATRKPVRKRKRTADVVREPDEQTVATPSRPRRRTSPQGGPDEPKSTPIGRMRRTTSPQLGKAEEETEARPRRITSPRGGADADAASPRVSRRTAIQGGADPVLPADTKPDGVPRRTAPGAGEPPAASAEASAPERPAVRRRNTNTFEPPVDETRARGEVRVSAPPRPRTPTPAPLRNDPDRWSDLEQASPMDHIARRAARARSVLPGKIPRASRRTARPAPPPGQVPPDLGVVLATLRATKNRDEACRLACDGVVGLGRVALLLVLKKGVLEGREAAGHDLSREAVRNLWIPATSRSQLARVVESGEPYLGPHGDTSADLVFRAAVGNRGGDVLLMPIVLSGHTIAVLCIDGPEERNTAVERAEVVGKALADALKRIIVSGKGE